LAILPPSRDLVKRSTITEIRETGGGGIKHRGSISPNFFRQTKSRRRTKKIAVQYHQGLKLQISSFNCRTFCQTLFAICPINAPKKFLSLFSRKSRNRVLVKLTQCADEGEPYLFIPLTFTKQDS